MPDPAAGEGGDRPLAAGLAHLDGPALLEHGQERHAPPGGQLLRYRNGRPITSRRYDGLWARLGRVLPWVRTQQLSMHWIRHIVAA